MKKLIYVVEDELSIRELYAATFESAGFDVCCFENGADMFVALKNMSPDIFILDIMLDGADGLEILASLKANNHYSNIPCIMVSAKGEELMKVKGLNLGADDYISKPFGVLELIARVKANLRKKPQNTQGCKDIKIENSTHAILVNNEKLTLTKKEFELLKLLVDNFQNLISREDIIKTIWGFDFEGETRTLDMHIKEIRKKLCEKGSNVEIETVRGVGFILK